MATKKFTSSSVLNRSLNPDETKQIIVHFSVHGYRNMVKYTEVVKTQSDYAALIRIFTVCTCPVDTFSQNTTQNFHPNIALDKIFFPEVLLMSIHNICFRKEIRKILTGYPLLS